MIIVLIVLSLLIYKIVDILRNDQYHSQIPMKMLGLEHFENLRQGSHSGFGFQRVDNSNTPLFVNFYRKELGQDFGLSNYLRKLKISQVPEPKYPIIFFPDIGASLIYAQWNRANSPTDEYVKNMDAYGNFQSSDKWKCKETSNDQYEKIWFPYDKDPLAQKCWSEIARTELSDTGMSQNGQGIDTRVGTLDEMFEWDNSTGKGPYDVFIKTLYTIGYNKNNLFIAHYDFRIIMKDISRLVQVLTAKINKMSNCIIIAHGFGACIANAFMQNVNAEWAKTNIKSFIPISGTWTGVPKTLKVLVSGDVMENKQESLLVRDTIRNYDGLYTMLPNNARYNYVFEMDGISYSKDTLPVLMKRIFGKTVDIPAAANFAQLYTKVPYNIPTLMMAGTGLPTESSYVYSSVSLNKPSEVKKDHVGDGTVPDFVQMDVYNDWVGKNANVQLKMYQQTEHLQIMFKEEPMRDLVDYLTNLN